MCERKYVKFRVDTYDDTKFKIIDMKPERDLIHYIWNRSVVLAGKVNLEGDLYMSKNIPYTIETLGIEFNRGAYQVKLAFDALMELEMIELTENNVYRVKNFAKHQNIKVKKNDKYSAKEENIKKDEVEVKENLLNEAAVIEVEVPTEVVQEKISKNKEEKVKENDIGSFIAIRKDINKINDNMSDNNQSYNKFNNLQGNNQISLENKKNKKSNKRKKKEVNIETIDEDVGDEMNDCFNKSTQDVKEDSICYFHNGDVGRSLGEGESLVKVWSF